MAENEILVTKIRTNDGDARIDYNALAHLPDLSKKQDAATAITKSNILTYLQDKTVAESDKLDGYDAEDFAMADHTHSDYFKWHADTHNLVLKSGVHYGDELPAAGTVGRIFLKKIEEV